MLQVEVTNLTLEPNELAAGTLAECLWRQSKGEAAGNWREYVLESRATVGKYGCYRVFAVGQPTLEALRATPGPHQVVTLGGLHDLKCPALPTQPWQCETLKYLRVRDTAD
jgi:hypothetical protein